MRKRLVGVAALGVALVAPPAFAADLPSRKEAPVYVPPPAPPPPPPMWTGFYGGLNIGGGWAANRWADTAVPYTDPALPGSLYVLPGAASSSPAGVVGGGQVGFNYQFGSLIAVGLETDFQGTSLSARNHNVALLASPFVPGDVLVPLAPRLGDASLPWFGAVRGRAGFLITPTLLLYGAGGFAYGEVHASNFSNVRTGWTAGGGAEWMFMPNWSAKAEYMFVDLSSGGKSGPLDAFTLGARRHPETNVVRAGLNYHLNFGAAAPVAASY